MRECAQRDSSRSRRDDRETSETLWLRQRHCGLLAGLGLECRRDTWFPLAIVAGRRAHTGGYATSRDITACAALLAFSSMAALMAGSQ